jgi:hypothetical protein
VSEWDELEEIGNMLRAVTPEVKRSSRQRRAGQRYYAFFINRLRVKQRGISAQQNHSLAYRKLVRISLPTTKA